MIEIRDAVPGDALGIALVGAYTWKTTYAGLMPHALIDARIDGVINAAKRRRADIERGMGTFVAVEDGVVIGFCMYGKSRNEAYADAGEIAALYVLKPFQGTGVGKALFRAAKEKLVLAGYRAMIVNCLVGNPFCAFYERMGGVIVGQRQDEAQGGHILTENILLFDLEKQP